jgi:hypothetical protein
MAREPAGHSLQATGRSVNWQNRAHFRGRGTDTVKRDWKLAKAWLRQELRT